MGGCGVGGAIDLTREFQTYIISANPLYTPFAYTPFTYDQAANVARFVSTVEQAFGECAKYFPCAAVSVYASSSASINFFVALYYSDTVALGYAMDVYGASLETDPDADVTRWRGTGLPDRAAGLECEGGSYAVDVVWFYRTWAFQFTDAFVGTSVAPALFRAR